MANIETVYPLAQVIEIKEKRVEDAKKVVLEKKRELEEEEKKLVQAEKERDEVQDHHSAKLQQLRDTLDADDINPDKVLQMKAYLEIVKQRLEEEEEKVKKQQEMVEAAEKRVEEAIAFQKEKEHEVDKLEMHREEWTKNMLMEVAREEAKEADELGSLMFLKKRREAKK